MTKEEWKAWKARTPKGASEVAYLHSSMLDGVEREFNFGQVESETFQVQRAQNGAIAHGLRVRLTNAVRRLREQA